MPGTTTAARNPKGCLVVEQVSVDLSADDTDPGRHGEEGNLERGEAVAAGNLRRCEVDGQRRGLHDGKAESNEDVGADEDGDRGAGDLQGHDSSAFLASKSASVTV